MSELFPAKTIALVYTSCMDPSREYEFNHWYSKVHVPNLLEIQGIDNVYRYRNMAAELREDQPCYLALFRLSSADPWDLMKRAMGEDSMIDCLEIHWVSVWDFIAYRRTVSPLARPERHLPDGMPEAIFVVPTVCTDPNREEEFRDWYLHTHFHDLLETPGVVQAHRYRSLNPDPRAGEALYLAIYEVDSDDPMGVMRRIFEDDRSIRIPQGRMINCIQAPFDMGTYRHIAL